MPTTPVTTELAAAWLQAAVTVGLAVLCLYVFRKYGKPYFGVWALAWGLYALRLGAIIRFMQTNGSIWLYWHQVATGLTALALLGAALALSRQLEWRARYAVLALFPVVWSYIAIYRLENFLLAAGPAVVFLSAATLWTGVTLLRHQRRIESVAARFLGWAFVLWSLHHLDYPFLRARGAWNPWGYYLDIGFELVIGAAILLLVLEEQGRGLRVLSDLAGDLQAEGSERAVLDGLLRRTLTLPGVRGTALFLGASGERGEFVAGAGDCSEWTTRAPASATTGPIADVLRTGRPVVLARGGGTGAPLPDTPFFAALPVFQDGAVTGAIIVTGEARDPFTALDEDFLIAVGHQVGTALARRDLVARLQLRGRELQELAGRMLDRHEEERRRLSRELHDETAQVLAAVRLQIGRALETATGPEAALMTRAVEMVGSGIQGVRRVIEDLRPALLDELGLRAALAAVAFDFERTSGVETTFRAPERLPALAAEQELAIFRAVQEGLANVGRHAGAAHVDVDVRVDGTGLFLTIEDDGRGVDASVARNGGSGLPGMRERFAVFAGEVELASRPRSGARLAIRMPLEPEVGG